MLPFWVYIVFSSFLLYFISIFRYMFFFIYFFSFGRKCKDFVYTSTVFPLCVVIKNKYGGWFISFALNSFKLTTYPKVEFNYAGNR